MFDATANNSTVRALSGFCLGIALLVVGGAAYAGSVQCVPDVVSFSALDETAAIRLFIDGTPVASADVRGARAMIDDRNYSHQFLIERSKQGPAMITIRPNPAHVQVGEFTLRIDTREGQAITKIETPLDALPGTIENRATTLGISVEQLKAELNLLQPSQRERITVELPESHEEGYVFELALGKNPEHDYRWIVNGETVAEGKGETTLRHVFTQPGPNSIQFEERTNGGLVAAWTGTLAVGPAPVVPWEVPANREVSLPGPPGYTNYTWRVDGESASREPILRHAFGQKGRHQIECLAEIPDKGAKEEYRRMIWDVTVK